MQKAQAKSKAHTKICIFLRENWVYALGKQIMFLSQQNLEGNYHYLRKKHIGTFNAGLPWQQVSWQCLIGKVGENACRILIKDFPPDSSGLFSENQVGWAPNVLQHIPFAIFIETHPPHSRLYTANKSTHDCPISAIIARKQLTCLGNKIVVKGNVNSLKR